MADRRGSWDTSPAGLRIREWLEAGNAGTVRAIADACHTHTVNARDYLNQMHSDGCVHVSGWERANPFGGGPVGKVWAWGVSPDAPRPERRTKAVSSRASRTRIKELFGDEVGRAILTAIARKRSSVVVGGVTVYRRGEGIKRDAAARIAP